MAKGRKEYRHPAGTAPSSAVLQWNEFFSKRWRRTQVSKVVSANPLLSDFRGQESNVSYVYVGNG